MRASRVVPLSRVRCRLPVSIKADTTVCVTGISAVSENIFEILGISARAADMVESLGKLAEEVRVFPDSVSMLPPGVWQ